MSKAFEEIAKEASELSREQRLNLASLLLELNDVSPDADVTAEWEQEILARIRAIDENEVEGISFEAVMREAEDRLTSCLVPSPLRTNENSPALECWDRSVLET